MSATIGFDLCLAVSCETTGMKSPHPIGFSADSTTSAGRRSSQRVHTGTFGSFTNIEQETAIAEETRAIDIEKESAIEETSYET